MDQQYQAIHWSICIGSTYRVSPLDLDLELPPSTRKPTTRNRTTPHHRHRPTPNLCPRIHATTPLNNSTRSGRPSQRSESDQRAHHAEPRAHLLRVGRQARQGADVDALAGAGDGAVEGSEDVHTGARVDADPGVDDDAQAAEEGHVGVDGAEHVVG